MRRIRPTSALAAAWPRAARALAGAIVLIGGVSASGATDRVEGVLAAVEARGYVRCGVHRSGVGLAEVRTDGAWAGYFVEVCRAVALAAVGDGEAIRVHEIDDLSAALALREREVDVVLSAIRPEDAAADPGIAYLAPVLQDVQLLVSFREGIAGVGDLPPMARICTSGHPTVQSTLRRALGDRAGLVRIATYDSIDGLFNAFFRQRCDALSYHRFAVLAQSLLRSPQRSAMWQSELSLGSITFAAAVRDDDSAWMAVVDAAVRAALHGDGPALDHVPEHLRQGLVARVRALAGAPTAIFDRSLGHMGGQGFLAPPLLAVPGS